MAEFRVGFAVRCGIRVFGRRAVMARGEGKGYNSAASVPVWPRKNYITYVKECGAGVEIGDG